MDNLSTIIAVAVEVAAPEDGNTGQWVELVPGPEIRFRDGRPTLTMDNPDEVILASDIERGIPVDFDHQSDHIGKSAADAPAAGWIVAMASRNGGIEALVEWTKMGRERLADRQYRFISPVIKFTKDKHRVVNIVRAGLTNNPALTMKALAASEERADGQPDTKATTRPTPFWRELTAALGIEETATKADVMTRIEAMKMAEVAAHEGDESIEPASAKTEALARDTATLTAHIDSVNRERNDERVELAIAQASREGKLPPATHQWARELCAANPELFGEFIRKIEPVISFGTLGLDGIPPSSRTSASPMQADAETALCAQLGVKPEDLR